MFPPHNVGGEEIYVEKIYRSLGINKKNIVYNINNSYKKKFDDKKIINISCRNSLILGSFFLPNPNIFLKLRKTINRIKPEIIHINNTHSTISSEIFFISRKYPKVVEIHDYALFCFKGDNIKNNKPCNQFGNCSQCVHQSFLNSLNNKYDYGFYKIITWLWIKTNCCFRNQLIYKIKRFMVTQALSRVNKIICPSKNVIETCKKFGMEEKKLEYLPYGVDISLYRQTEIPKRPIIGFVGRLVKIKGCHVLIKAFKQVVKEIPEAQLHIIGNGKQEKILKKLTTLLKLDKNIFFLGAKPLDELIKKFYPSIQFLVVPSIWLETPALVVYDAMASRRPVVATAIGDFAEMIDNGENGYLFKRNNSDDLANKIINLLKNPKLIEKFSQKSFETIHKFTIQEHNKRLIDIYKDN
jgi:glycosyltransferase involved in cell wall biosynthesis